jgi:hypothetical protein
VLRGALAWGWLALGAACAGPQTRSPEYPRNETICQYVGLEAEEAPQQMDTDATSFVAVYRFREASVPAPKQPLTVKFRVNRSRVNELRSHLASQPEVICSPDADLHYQVKVKPLPGSTTVEPATAPAGAAQPEVAPAEASY